MRKINVIYCGYGENVLIGQLANIDQNILFEYSEQALDLGIEFSPLHLKLSQTTYKQFPSHQYKLPGLIYDSLPDGWGLLLMDRAFSKYGIKPTALTRLAFIGERAMGALSFEPEKFFDDSDAILSIDVIADATKQILNEDSTEAILKLVSISGSPQGARPKALVSRDSFGRWSSDLQKGTPYLVKFPGKDEHPEVCEIESWYANAARSAGYIITETETIRIAGKVAAFAIKRFDRKQGERVLTHSLAGFLHEDFRMANVSYDTLLRATKLITGSNVERTQAFERCCLNVIAHNRDDHTKNFSWILGQDKKWKFSPVYDFTFSNGPFGEHHLDVGGKGKDIKKEDLIKLGQDNELEDSVINTAIHKSMGFREALIDTKQDYEIRSTTVNNILSKISQF